MPPNDIMIPAWVDGKLVPVEKLAVHQRGLRHLAVSVFVLCEDRILLQQRALGKYHTPGLWANTCCTHPMWGEDPLACAHRRLAEELGITGLDLVHRGQVEYRADVGKGLIEHELVDVFIAQTQNDLTVNPNPEEVMHTDWRTHAELQKDIAQKPVSFTPWLRIYLEKHADMILGGT
ncbi:isopentenyl-diphosphate Delta-isomerase [Sulfitobacter sp. F26204]|uniref:isopentenyl-diphosphate Delta-isomerase n=1 Tax=Sulfitobacter sp. F26204 TaxID=2996014 RepID=UPI00225E2F45|nr:isopentenyl-diphosphate Delta-isomerase [Sulfitobacter sp. F26204]MCX7561232.1 isopentenyl-diphosphate Delta-isomerase [Sulfitobacter sp. F26204]